MLIKSGVDFPACLSVCSTLHTYFIFKAIFKIFDLIEQAHRSVLGKTELKYLPWSLSKGKIT